LPNAVDHRRYEPVFGGDGPLVYVGRVSREKGILTLLEAMRRVRNARLVVAGEGDAAAEVGAFIARHKMDNVELVGHLGPETLMELLREARFVVMPSDCYENCPFALLEAFALGKPAIAASIGGIPELVDEGETGLLFRPGDAADLAEKIRLLLARPEAIRSMGKNARRKIETAYNLAEHCARLLEVYRDIQWRN